MEQTIASSQADIGEREMGDIAWRPFVAAVVSFLANVWQWIHGGIWSVQNKLTADIGRPLDIERISKHLEVVKRAEEEGSRNLPPSGEDVPAGTQREIIAYFKNLRQCAQQQVAETAEKSTRTLEQIHDSDALAKLRDIPAGCENKILRFVADFEFRLSNAAEQEKNQKRHYDAFREKNGLDRVAYYPGAAYLYYLVIPVLMVTIAFALASLVVSDAGGNSSVSVAWIGMISAAVVIVPFVFGNISLRSTNHVSEFKNFTGWIGVIVAIATIFGLAYYTDFHVAAVLANPDASNREVFDVMLAAPLDVVSSVGSWTIFGSVTLTGLLAMLLGYRSDDPYPGYGAAQRSYYRARDAGENVSSRLRNRINALVDEAEAEVASMAHGRKSMVRTYTRLVEKSQQNPSALNDYDNELEDACNIVLDRYRVINTAARQSNAPMSFAEHICFNTERALDSGWHSRNSGHVAELQNALAELEHEANSARQTLRALNLRMINSVAAP